MRMSIYFTIPFVHRMFTQMEILLTESSKEVKNDLLCRTHGKVMTQLKNNLNWFFRVLIFKKEKGKEKKNKRTKIN